LFGFSIIVLIATMFGE